MTLREAAEFTKIRTDYLQSMEANQFESIPLADVYKRGFVKVYAKYLRLDDEKAGADFNTHHSAKASRRPLEAAADEDAQGGHDHAKHLSHLGQFVLRHVAHQLVVQPVFTGCGRIQAADNVHQRGFARA